MSPPVETGSRLSAQSRSGIDEPTVAWERSFFYFDSNFQLILYKNARVLSFLFFYYVYINYYGKL